MQESLKFFINYTRIQWQQSGDSEVSNDFPMNIIYPENLKTFIIYLNDLLSIFVHKKNKNTKN